MFKNHEESHEHSLETLNLFYEYDDFMESVGTLADLGCGSGLDLEWWATRTTRDDVPQPLEIKCTGIDLLDSLPVAHRYPNIVYQRNDFEQAVDAPSTKFDVLWCHDAFQYCINPVAALSRWWHATSDGGMLVLILPQTASIVRRQLIHTQQTGCYHHHSLVSLIHQLAVSGWDCQNGFFLKRPTDPWLHAIAYKSTHQPMDPRTTTWYDLADRQLLPESAAEGVQSRGHLTHSDLILPWLDKSFIHYGE
jgi:SAM-dependent methyltransferase